MRENIIDVDDYIYKNQIDYNNTIYGQKFHISPKVGLINDPNGFCEYNGKYHLFYQTYPFGTFHGLKYWYHLTSGDLVSWQEEGIALKPEFWYEIDGCFSGNAFVKDGKLHLFYTGNIWDSTGEEVGEEYQIIATSVDGINFEKIPQPIITMPGEVYSSHFRDPKVWEKDKVFYLIIGAQTIDRKARIILYKSLDLYKWEYKGVIAGNGIGKNYNKGYMWECPSYANIDNKDFLFFCPQGVGDSTENYHQSGYVYGIMDCDECRFEHEGFYKLDYGFEFYAPQIYTDLKERHLCIGWMGLPDQDQHPTVKEGHLHCLSLPTELTFKNNKLHRAPLPELEMLRKTEIIPEVCYKEIIWTKSSYEFCCTLNHEKGDKGVCFKLRSNGSGEYLSFIIDNLNKYMVLDRSHTNTQYDTVRKVYLGDNNVKKLQVFVDTSSVEIFVNEGEYVFTTRLFIGRDGVFNSISFDDPKVITKIQVWEI
jgi:beta-fructofuranosidase